MGAVFDLFRDSFSYFLMAVVLVGLLMWRFAGALLDEAAKDLWRMIWDRINRPPRL